MLHRICRDLVVVITAVFSRLCLPGERQDVEEDVVQVRCRVVHGDEGSDGARYRDADLMPDFRWSVGQWSCLTRDFRWSVGQWSGLLDISRGPLGNGPLGNDPV